MRTPRTILSTALAALFLLALSGCTGGGSPPPSAMTNALVRGETDAMASGSAEVEVYAVDPSGSLIDLTPRPGLVDEEGSYEVGIDGSLIAGEDRLLVRITSEGELSRSVLTTATFSPTAELTAPFADARSTGMAELTLATLDRSDVDLYGEPSMLAVFLSEGALIEVGERASEEATLDATARTVGAAQIAFEETLTSEAVGITRSELRAAMEAAASSTAELQGTIDGGGSIDDSAFIEAFIEAQQSAGIDAEATAAATWASAEATHTVSMELGEELSEELSLSADRLRGEAAAESAIATLGAVSSEARLRAEEAAADLRASLDAATTTEAAAAAMATFEADLRAATSATFGVTSTVIGELMAALDAAATEARSTLDEVSTSATTEAIAETTATAYARLSASADAAVDSPLLEVEGVTHAEAEAMARLVTLVMASTDA